MSKFEYACFVSYRNSRQIDGLISTFARELRNALEKYLDAYLYEDISKIENPDMVFLDENIIETGDFLPKELGQGLSKSICWICIFTRSYLGGSLWCASELHGMVHLQGKREELLQFTKDEHRFILPILLRGDSSDLPNILSNHIFTDKFKKFTLASKNIYENEGFVDHIDAMAALIAQKQKILIEKCAENKIDLLDIHKDFVLKDVYKPNEKAEIETFVNSLKSPKAPAFPVA
jgi:hypothetical protein